MKRTPPPIPQGYRVLKRVGTQCQPGDLGWRNWRRPDTAWSSARCHVITEYDEPNGDVFLRRIDGKRLKHFPACAACGRTHYRQGMGYGESAELPVKLVELRPGRLVCTRCISVPKGQVTRHFNLVRRLSGRPTYEGLPIDASAARRLHIQRALS